MSSKRVLITGCDGFIASHLADHILATDDKVEIYGTVRRLSNRDNIKHLDGKIKLVEMELTDSKSVSSVIENVNPSKVFSLAAQTYVPTSWSAPDSTINTNIIGTLNILEAVKNKCPKAFVQIAGSSEEYGMVYPEECPIKETNQLRPLSPYGVSKVATDRLGYQYAKSYGLNVLVSRTFNQTGPRRGEVFVDSNFAKQVVEIERGKRDLLYHGNLDAIRDFTDARDTVRAYWELSNLKWNGEAVNICSGKGHTIEEVLSTLISKSTANIISIPDEKRTRPSDVSILIGDTTKLKMYTDWTPKISWEKSLEDLLNYWRIMIPATSEYKYPELRT